jgi:hypothetical protein
MDQQLLDASIELSPFSLIFDILETPQSSDYEAAVRVTRESLKQFLVYVLDDSLEFFALNSHKWGMTSKGPRIYFIANIKFIDGAAELRDTEIMEQIQKGFIEESFLDHYLGHLLQLDPSNPFQKTKNVQFHSKYSKQHHTAYIKIHLNESKSESRTLSAFAGAAVLLGISCLIFQQFKTSQSMAPTTATKNSAPNKNPSTEFPSSPLSWMPRYWLAEDDTVDEEEED